MSDCDQKRPAPLKLSCTSYIIDLDLPGTSLISSPKLQILFSSSSPAMSAPPRPVTKSKYLRNPPPPLQLKSSFHHPRTKRASRRISRDKSRASVQSLESAGPLSPITPRSKMPSKKEQHRRRLLKLKRTFGEEVPTELINSSILSGSLKDLPSLGSSPQSLSHIALHLPSLPLGSNPNSPSFRPRKKGILGSISGARQTPSVSPVQVNIVKKISHETPRPPASPLVILISTHESTINLSSSDDDQLPSSPSVNRTPVQSDRMTSGSRSQWPRTPFVHAFEPSVAHLVPPSLADSGRQTAKRNERRQGWSGEWNQPDIQDVIERLRNIK
ncbi:hypothetical protein HYPSUDRAFT_69349 [Hypholoma sublateritium FD-334 SS-4]|uniref:Uncharacterized protein n=1 Tax=Hypholoma sublateritium (strain FD-334 SS-4) TaxID=945553 RepID=A0A0D2NQZ5_HYPSF|nr:hypothetical protein HYPSUDRAFT_69349 [Hypholoma sublateritium FD-334 SS-4]